MVGGWSLDGWRLEQGWLEVGARMVGGRSKYGCRLELGWLKVGIRMVVGLCYRMVGN